MGRNHGPGPPRWAASLLRSVLSPGLPSDGILGDLHEEFLERAERSLTLARVWYATVATAMAIRFAVGRRQRHAPDHEGGGGMMVGWRRDLVYALRRTRSEPGFSAVLVLTIAVAVGANAAIFGAVRPVVAPQLPFPEAQRLVRVWEANDQRGWTRSSDSWQDARDWAAATTTLDGLAVYNTWEGNLVTGDGAQRIRYTLAEPDFFRTLGVAPLLGRVLAPEEIDPSRSDVVILSQGLWTRAFGADPAVIGRTVRLAGRTLEVVGVMPASFQYPAADVDAWKPWHITPDQGGRRDSYWVSAVARLAPGVTLTQAQREMTAIGRALERAHPDTNEGFRPLLEPVADVAVLNARQGVMLLWGAVGLLLLVACANVATLLLARGEARTTEIHVRSSLGAGRGALMRQLLAESLLTAILGGALGIALALPALNGVRVLLGGRLSYGLAVELNPAVIGYTLLVTGVAGIAFGLLPALRLSADGPGPAAGVRGSAGRGSFRTGRALVIAQTALAVVILTGAGLLGRSMQRLAAVDPGFALGSALTFRVAPPQEGMDRQEASVLLESIRARVAAIPGVTAVAAANRLPFSGNMWNAEWTDQARPDEAPLRAFARVVQPGLLETLGVAVLRGRALLPTDDAGAAPVAVVSRSAADRFWGADDPIGSRLSLAPDDDRAPWVRVVGIVDDVETTQLGAGPGAVVYTPFEQSVFGHFGDWGMDYVVRTEGEAAALAPAVRAAVAEVDPSLPAFDVSTLRERYRDQLQAPKALGLLMTTFAAVALLLAALGIYGTLAYAVARSRPEIGVRLALGARPSAVVARILGRGAVLTGVGLVAGLALAAVAGRWLEGLLFGVDPLDPVTYLGIVGVLGVAALAASALPAWRATRVDAVEALRGD